MKAEEWFVVAAVLVGLFAFEAMPKLLNVIKKKRQGDDSKKAS